MKLNTDGSSVDNPGLASCGGVVRDENGPWVAVSQEALGSLATLQLSFGCAAT